jgi:large subunit ribosomal protein L9
MAHHVQVLLQADVDNLGTGGEVVKVRAGFARNFLLPRGLALPATESNLLRVEELKKQASQRMQLEVTKAQEIGAKISAVTVKIERAAAGDENKMYGSVTAKDLEEAFAAQGVQLDRKKIQLKEPLRQFGPFEVPLKLHAAHTISLKGEVVKKGNAV